MFDPAKFILFLVAALILVVTPGPAVLYIVTRGIDQGRAAGIVSVLGVGLGNFVHVLAAALGLSALLASSALAFSVVKYAGAAYLIFLGLRKLLSPAVDVGPVKLREASRAAIFRQGAIVAALNPKTALFFLAFLPQFTDPGRGAVWLQLVVLGSITVSLGVASDSVYALLSGSLAEWFKRKKTFLRGEKYLSGTVYCGLGVATAISGGGRSS